MPATKTMDTPASFPAGGPTLRLNPDDSLIVPDRCPHNGPARTTKIVRSAPAPDHRWRTMIDYACSFGCYLEHEDTAWPEVVRTESGRRLSILGG